MESVPVLVILGLVVLVFAWSIMRFWGKMTETTKNKEIAEAKTELLRQQKDALRTDIDKLETDRGKEEFFRQNYGLGKVGEEVVVIVDRAAETEKEKQGSISSFFSFLANLFK